MIERDLIIAHLKVASGTKTRHQAIGALNALKNIATRAGELSIGEDLQRDVEVVKHHDWRKKKRTMSVKGG